MEGKIAEINVEDFMDRLVDGPNPTKTIQTVFQGISFNGDAFKNSESAMYTNFCKVIQSILDLNPVNDLVAKDTGDWPDLTDTSDAKEGRSIKPDVSIYPRYAKDAFTLTDAEIGKSKAKTLPDRQPYLARVDWHSMVVPVEFKSNQEAAAFQFFDDKKNFTLDTDKGRLARGQITDYASMLLRRQPRTFCHMILICKSRARLMFWDRAGAVVSTAFDFVREPTKLFTFVYKLSMMDRAQRGYDPTAVLATQEEADLMKNCKPRLSYERKCLSEAMERRWPIYKISVRSEDVIPEQSLRPAGIENASIGAVEAGASGDAAQPSVRCFLVGKRRVASDSPIGRGTRGYVAYDMNTGRLVFLKDSWRIDSPSCRPEREVYERLWKNGVRNIATPISGGDVCNADGRTQRTRTQDFLPQLHGRVHYRLVVKEIGRPLEEYPEEVVMANVMIDAIEAHRDAWEKAEVLHRDISAGNILIYYDEDDDPDRGVKVMPRGILNDWDLCKYKEDLNSGATQRGRSGTWQFMSAILLASPGTKAHEVSDDIESFIHVILWLCLRFHAHKTRFTAEIKFLFERIYDFRMRPDGKPDLILGGFGKLDWITKGEPPIHILKNPPLSGLLDDLALLCQQHYNTIDTDSLRQPELAVEKYDEKESVYPVKRRVNTTASISNTTRSNTASSIRPPAPATAAEPTLSTHTKILEILVGWAEYPGWLSTKGPDMFDRFPYTGNFGSSEAPTTAPKRKSKQSDVTMDAPEPKKIKRSTHRSSRAELDIIAENLENVHA